MFVATSAWHPWQWSPLVILPARFPKKLISVVVRLLLASVLSFYYYTVCLVNISEMVLCT